MMRHRTGATPIPQQSEAEALLEQSAQHKKESCLKACNTAANYVVCLLRRQDYRRARRFMERLAMTYRRTRAGLARVAIENIFIYRVADLVLLAENRKELMELFPKDFRKVINRQINAGAI